MKNLHLQRRTAKHATTNPTTTTATAKTTTTTTAADVTESKAMMNALEKKLKKEIKSQHKKSSSSPPTEKKDIDPPRLHRDMRLICDVFRISEQSRYALRAFDAATLEDFSLMTNEDFTDLVVTHARLGTPIPPLQQRKIRVLLSWAQSIASVDNLEVTQTSSSFSSPNKSQSVDMNESNEYHAAVINNKVGSDKSSQIRKRRGTFIPADWEDKFYADLPRLRKELQMLGGQGSSSNWALEFLSLRWIFCG